jgi:hypothetical protein
MKCNWYLWVPVVQFGLQLALSEHGLADAAQTEAAVTAHKRPAAQIAK